MSNIGERIKEVRISLGFTQQEFADWLGMKRATISSYEAGRAILNEPTVSLICREFKVSEEWLRNGTGKMFLPAETSTLDQLTREYHLSSHGRRMIEKFVSLPADQRSVFTKFIVSFSDSIARSDPAPSWIDLEAEDYRRELEVNSQSSNDTTDRPN